jgi:ribonucleoside-diphosphate reductase alpha chain
MSVVTGSEVSGANSGQQGLGPKGTVVIGGAASGGLSKKASERLSRVVVVKRNGMIVPFRRDRVLSAIESAFRDVLTIPESSALPQDTHSMVQAVAEEVVEECVEQASSSGAALTVEAIQDIVEIKLMEAGHYEIARSYIVYRDERKALREDSPLNLKVTRRDGSTVVRFNPAKIATAIEKAFRASRKVEGATPQEIVDAVNVLTTRVVARSQELVKSGTTLHVELIQDEVERQMMAEGFYQEAKDFIIYRATRAALRAKDAVSLKEPSGSERRKAELRALAGAVADPRQLKIEEVGVIFKMTLPSGETATVSEGELRRRITHACKGLPDTNPEAVLEESIKNLYEGVKSDEVDTSSVMAARAKIEGEPNYSNVAARLLLDVIYRETMGVEAHDPKLEEAHQSYFKSVIKRGVEVDRMGKELLTFDLEKLSKALKLERDLQFTYLGAQTLYDRYLIHHEDRRLETPQIFWMRVAMGLASNEANAKNERAIEFYEVLSKFHFTSSTPTLFNAGTPHPQLSSCYLTTVMDDLKHIFKCVQDDAMLSKWAGGLGNDWTNVRATGARIKGTNGRSQGVIPFLKVANDTAVAVNQGGKRKGAMCAYLETWHLDIEDFLELRKNTGDERRRTHDMNTANWIPDLFMKRVLENGYWTLFSPSDVPDLHDLVGKAFEERYVSYEKKAESGELKLFKRVEAVGIWRKMLSMLFETGHPWITFKDPSNLRSPQDHVGVVHSSNLCTEILLNTSSGETAVCNLGSVNLAAHCTPNGLDKELVAKTVRTAVRMLDNVIDINFYPTDEAKTANLRHRPIGLGIMGFQDALYIQNISYASPEAVEFADSSMELISYNAILASTELAKEKGAYSTFEGSKWDRGLLPIDTIEILAAERGGNLEVDRNVRLDWAPVREAIAQHGIRNSNTMAIAPTATISNITGVVQSIEPTYKHLYAKSNLSGEFTVPNVHLVQALKLRGMWDDEMIEDLKYFDGSLLEIERVPDEIKRVYLTAFEIEPEWLIECGSRRQKWIDMGQSLNLYMAQPSGKRLHDMYVDAWKKGLKTTYYLRSLGATQIEKSTLDINKRGMQPRWMKNKSASSNVQVGRVEGEEAAATSGVGASESTPAGGNVPAQQPSGLQAVVEKSAVEKSGSAKKDAGKAELPRAMCSLDGDCESCQ